MSTITADIQSFRIIKEKMGEQGSEALLSFLDYKLKENNEENLKVLATKEDIAKLEGRFTGVETKITGVAGGLETKIAGLEGKLETKIVGLEGKLDNKMAGLEGRLDNKIASLETKILNLEGRFDTKVAGLEGQLDTKMAGLEGRLEAKIAEAKADTIKWMFIFWTGSIITTLGGMFAFLKIFLTK